MKAKYLYTFDEGSAKMKDILGGKGAHLAEMKKLSLNIPEGFTISTECSIRYLEDESFINELIHEIREHICLLEKKTGKKFNDSKNPLFVSVRSGAAVSMPGMMDTILNLGLNKKSVKILAEITNNSVFAYDSYLRFLKMFGNVVYGIPYEDFYAIKAQNPEDLADLYIEKIQSVDPNFDDSDTEGQILKAISSVFNSWNNPRAISYRKINHIDDNLGTAVTIQEMVFGNLNDDSGTGILFTRNPSNGKDEIYGEVLFNAQGEDIVDGSKTPLKISELAAKMPDVYNDLQRFSKQLEYLFAHPQDIEFTIENKKLFILQTRNAKITPHASVKIAVDMYKASMISKADALLMQNPDTLSALLFPQFKEDQNLNVIAKGLPAAPGSVSGMVYFDSESAKYHAERGEDVILVRTETSPEDIDGIYLANGILTAKGGMTSHAAVVARGFGKCCVAGSSDITIDSRNKILTTSNGIVLHEGDWISLDGFKGEVYLGKIETENLKISDELNTILEFADEFRTLGVMVNADTPEAAMKALEFGADGIGLCRTEHMFFDEDRIMPMREMIVSKTKEERKRALSKLLPMQRNDFKAMYDIMQGRHITIRLLDPPLHEFLPKTDSDIKELANQMGIEFYELKNTVKSLEEVNPMLGYRGCRLAVTYTEIAEMQTQAIIEAAIESFKASGIMPDVEIMIPLISEVKEFNFVKGLVKLVADHYIEKSGMKLKYKIGTMIEIPRAALLSDEIAKESEFFSFGTNDLTQMTFGFSRDDAGKFLFDYYSKGLLDDDPFETIDQKGVGKLMETSVKLGRSTRPDLQCGICGEHGGDPRSIEFCNRIGLNYVSCSPFRVYIAKISAAISAIKLGKSLHIM